MIFVMPNYAPYTKVGHCRIAHAVLLFLRADDGYSAGHYTGCCDCLRALCLLFRRGPFSWNMTSRLPYIIHSNMSNSNSSSDSTGRSSLESQIPNQTGQRRELWKQRTAQADVERDPEATPCKATA